MDSSREGRIWAAEGTGPEWVRGTVDLTQTVAGGRIAGHAQGQSLRIG